MNLVIWFRRTAVLLGGKYLAMNTFFMSFQLVIEFDRRESNHDHALPLREKGNSLRRIASGEEPLVFKVSTNWMKTFKC